MRTAPIITSPASTRFHPYPSFSSSNESHEALSHDVRFSLAAAVDSAMRAAGARALALPAPRDAIE